LDASRSSSGGWFYRQISLPRHPEPELDQAQASYFSNLFAAAAASFNSVPQASLVPAVLPPLAPNVPAAVTVPLAPATAANVPAAVTVPLAPATAGLAALYDPVFGLIEAHRKAEAAHIASLREQERLADIWHCDAAEQACHEEFRIFDALLVAAATTLPGLVAKLIYLQDIANREAWMLEDRPDAAIHLLEGFMASVTNVCKAMRLAPASP
jgi:hypothetical protein